MVTHRRRAAELGISNRDLGFTVSALVDGAKVSDYQHEGHEIDLKVRADESFRPSHPFAGADADRHARRATW